MERIRIDRRDLSLRARRRDVLRDVPAPLVCAAGDGADIDEDLLARIDALLAEPIPSRRGSPDEDPDPGP